MKKLWKKKRANSFKSYIIWSNFHEMCGKGKYIKTENRLVVTGYLGIERLRKKMVLKINWHGDLWE